MVFSEAFLRRFSIQQLIYGSVLHESVFLEHLFSKTELAEKKKWHEVLSYRGLYGNLSDKNNPSVSNDLFLFTLTTSFMVDTPYMEADVGVENILKVLCFDYVW